MNCKLTVGLGSNLTNLTLIVVYTVFLDCSSVEFVEVLTGSTDIDVEYCYVYIGIFISDEDSVLGCLHTADL